MGDGGTAAQAKLDPDLHRDDDDIKKPRENLQGFLSIMSFERSGHGVPAQGWCASGAENFPINYFVYVNEMETPIEDMALQLFK